MGADGETLAKIVEFRAKTIETVAKRLGVEERTVQRWLDGKTSPYPVNRAALAEFLDVPLALLIQVVWADQSASEEEREVNRRSLLAYVVKGASGLALASQLPGCAPLEVSERASRLVARFAATDPGTMLAEAVGLLGTVQEMLDARLSPEEREQMLSDAVDLASMAAWSATMSHRRAEAAAFFALAREYADHSEDPFLKGAALASSARLDRPIAANRPTAALGKLQVAIPSLGNSVMGQWAIRLEAEAYASKNLPDECEAALERANWMAPFDSPRGFFSSAGLLPDWDADGEDDQWAGACYAYLGQADRAIEHTHRALPGKRNDPLNVIAVSSDAAVAYAVAREPEESCAHAVRALDGAQETGYRAGVVRVRQVRARLEDWAPLACVQELDERLLLVP